MPQGAESLHVAGAGNVDPFLLAIVCVIFVIGAVVPIAAAILSSMRDDREAKRAALADQQVSNPVAENVVVAVDVVELEPVAPEMFADVANDQPHLKAAGGTR
ncbi:MULTISPECIES: hypothetical protein [Thalassobaculum]|uniref:Uncharacterized protein n=1 Tax=Thalassobaculum litoreum DSM 18839 TaxID=1123362 RepID=A0A8G2EV07_9PROT|nr:MULTISPECIES: hypothetical protein [Thalassobaculum]SDF65112.1 hypothetical protein SAMN05660686_01922 [Thalassobaculum litoreum DSM 18839]